MVPLVIALLTVCAQNSCKTVGNKECKFPFSWNGLTLSSCTYFNSVGHAYTSEEGAWCATAVGSNNEYVKDSGDWDYCNKNCPVEESNLHWAKKPDACITTDLLECISECEESSDSLVQYPWCYTSEDKSWGRCDMATCTLRNLKGGDSCDSGKEDKCVLPLVCDNDSKQCIPDKGWENTWTYVSTSFATAASIYNKKGNMVKNKKIIINKSSTSWCPYRSIVDNESDETNHRTIMEEESSLCYQPCYSASSWSFGAYRTPGICWGCPKGYGYSHASLCYVNGRHLEKALNIQASAGVVLRSYITGSKPFTLFGNYDAYFDDLACSTSDDPDDWTYDHWNTTTNGVVMGRYRSLKRNLAVISFRGTDEANDFFEYNLDAGSDFNLPDSKNRKASSHSRSSKKCDGDKACNGVFLPTADYWGGFADYLLEVKGKFAEWLTEAQKDKNDIVLTGHSLGGAAAYFAGYYATNRGIKPTAVITWASPKIAKSKWITRYENQVGCDRTISFANDYDLIVTLPPFGDYDVPCTLRKIKLPAQNQGFRHKGSVPRHDLFTGYHLGLTAFFQAEGKNIPMDSSCPFVSAPKHCRTDSECTDPSKICQFGQCVSLRSGDYCHGNYVSKCGPDLKCMRVEGEKCTTDDKTKGACYCKSTDLVCFGYWKPGKTNVEIFDETVVSNEEACVALCRSTEGCNLVTYDHTVNKCYRKKVDGNYRAHSSDCDANRDGRTYAIDRHTRSAQARSARVQDGGSPLLMVGVACLVVFAVIGILGAVSWKVHREKVRQGRSVPAE